MPLTVLVTGATGCVGSNLLHELSRRGIRCIAFHRSGSNTIALEGLDVEHRIGDTRDKDSVVRAVQGCDVVFHTAAIVSFWRPRRAEQLEVNVGGTRNVVEACLETGIRKLVHTSSVAALGFRSDGKPVDETVEYNWGSGIGYRYSKHLAELEILKGVEKGLNASMLNPSIIVGARDYYVHGGQFVRDAARRGLPVKIHGTTNLVAVHDVVAGHISAMEHGAPGERYILSGENMTYADVFSIASRIAGKRPPRFEVPVSVVKAVAKICDGIGAITRKQPWITSELISGLEKINWYSNEKAKRELGFAPTSVEEAMKEAYRWYADHNLL